MEALEGKTLGIVGFGNIGRAIGRRGVGFGMKVLAVDAHPGQPGDGAEEVWPLDRLDEMCRTLDVLAISAPITPQTRGLISPARIAMLKKGSYVMVMSRGNIVDEPALIEALKSGQVGRRRLRRHARRAAAGRRPALEGAELHRHPAHLSPVPLTMGHVWRIFEENLSRFERGEPLMNVVDKKLGY